MVAELEFANIAAVDAALASPEGQATAADLANFAQAGVSIMIFDTENVSLTCAALITVPARRLAAVFTTMLLQDESTKHLDSAKSNSIPQQEKGPLAFPYQSISTAGEFAVNQKAKPAQRK